MPIYCQVAEEQLGFPCIEFLSGLHFVEADYPGAQAQAGILKTRSEMIVSEITGKNVSN